MTTLRYGMLLLALASCATLPPLEPYSKEVFRAANEADPMKPYRMREWPEDERVFHALVGQHRVYLKFVEIMEGHNTWAGSDSGWVAGITEMTSLEVMAKRWADKKGANQSDEFLDELQQVSEAGFLRPYAIRYLARAGWWMYPGMLASIDWDRFLEWRAAHLPVDHQPEPYAYYARDSFRSLFRPPPGDSIRFDVAAFEEGCGRGTEERKRKYEQWRSEAKKIRPRPLVLDSGDERIRALKLIKGDPKLQKHGVVFVGDHIALLLTSEALCRAGRGEFPAAEQAARELTELAPTWDVGYNLLPQILIKQGKLDEALEAADRQLAVAEAPCWKSRASVSRAEVHLLQGDAGDALSALRQASAYRQEDGALRRLHAAAEGREALGVVADRVLLAMLRAWRDNETCEEAAGGGAMEEEAGEGSK